MQPFKHLVKMYSPAWEACLWGSKTAGTAYWQAGKAWQHDKLMKTGFKAVKQTLLKTRSLKNW